MGSIDTQLVDPSSKSSMRMRDDYKRRSFRFVRYSLAWSHTVQTCGTLLAEESTERRSAE